MPKLLRRPETLTRAVARSIGEAILRGEFSPGQSLPEQDLAQRLGVSRGTVREAFRALAEQGIVDLFPHRGAFVVALTVRRAREIYTLRAELESFAARLAIQRGGYSPDRLKGLARALRSLETAVTRNDPFDVAEADMRFHELMTQASEHELLVETLSGLRLQMLLFIVNTKLIASDVEPEGPTHRRLLDAARTSDAALLASAIHRHISEAGELLVRKMLSLEAREPERPPPVHTNGQGRDGSRRRAPLRAGAG